MKYYNCRTFSLPPPLSLSFCENEFVSIYGSVAVFYPTFISSGSVSVEEAIEQVNKKTYVLNCPLGPRRGPLRAKLEL